MTHNTDHAIQLTLPEFASQAPVSEIPSRGLSAAGAVTLRMFEAVQQVTPGSDRDAFNCLVRIWADMVRLRALSEADRAAADRVTPFIEDLITAFEDEGRYDPLGEVYTRAKLGSEDQVFTPRYIVEYILEKTVEAISEREAPCETVLDPCTGTGRFLIVAAQKYGHRTRPLILYGIELDLDLYRACLVNMRFTPFVPSFILWGNALLIDADVNSPNWIRANKWEPDDWRTLKPDVEGTDLTEFSL